jgi:hypothetical protein
MLAEITYNRGVKCSIGQYTFPLNRGVLVRDSSIIKRCQITKGFSVNVIKAKAKKTVKVERTTTGKTKRATDSSDKKKRDK